MKISRASAGLSTLALALVAGLGLPALGQDKPESLLPPGFNEPPVPAPAPASNPRAPEAPPPGDTIAAPAPAAESALAGNETAANEGAAEAPPPVDLSKFELPAFARRSLARVGPSSPASLGLAPRAFGRADGRYLEALMRRLDAPIASRWLSIALRRTLLSRVDTPARVNGADFAAERAWLLLRMGEAVAARALVQSVDVDNYTPKLFQIAQQSMLATADPAGMCPLVDGAQRVLSERGWVLAAAMCDGLAGKANEAGKAIDLAEARGVAGGLDLRLAEKIVGTGAEGRRAVTIEWDGVDRLTAWRFGLASATGVEVPEALYATAGTQVRYWRALLPGADPRSRALSAELAAAQGIFSSAALVDLYGEVDEQGENGPEASLARDLRSAFTAPENADRVKYLRQLWDAGSSLRLRYARLVLTARAATTIPTAGVGAEDADQLVAAMLSGGLVPSALAWREVASKGSDARALLLVAEPGNPLVDAGEVDAFRGKATRRKAQMLAAALAGLGRLDTAQANRLAQSLDIAIGEQNPWTWAIDAAARRGEAGTVVLLAAVGMQTRVWQGVPPEALFHIVAGLRAVGLDNYARMIAAEAITRS